MIDFPFDDHVASSIDVLLANLCGEQDRTAEMSTIFEAKTGETDKRGNVVYQNPLPGGSIELRRKMMRSYNFMSREDIPPTRDNLLNTLHSFMGVARDESIEKTVDGILDKATDDRDVRVLSTFLEGKARKLRVQAAEAQVRDILVDAAPYEMEEKLNEAVSILSDVMDEGEHDAPEVSMKDARQWYENLLAKRKRFRDSGRGYPSLKFRDLVKGVHDSQGNLRRKPPVPRLNWGEVTMMTGVTGTGKTTIAQILAEHNAWRESHDVLYIHLETQTSVLLDRAITRRSLIPTDYLQEELDPTKEDDPHLKTAYAWLDWMARDKKKFPGESYAHNSGRLVYKFCSGWNVYKLINLIRAMRLHSDERERGLVVVVDYYDIIPRDEFGNNDAYARGAVVRKLRDAINQENHKATIGVHGILMAQENKHHPGQPYGSQEIEQYVQLMISIRRFEELAKSDLSVTDDNGEQMYDALGDPRYYHRAGNYDSFLKLDITKGNNVGRGFIYLRQEAAMGRIECLPPGQAMIEYQEKPL